MGIDGHLIMVSMMQGVDVLFMFFWLEKDVSVFPIFTLASDCSPLGCLVTTRLSPFPLNLPPTRFVKFPVDNIFYGNCIIP